MSRPPVRLTQHCAKLSLHTNDPKYFTVDLPVLLECAAPITLAPTWTAPQFSTGFQHLSNPGGLTWHPDGMAFARMNGDGSITVRDAVSMETTQVLRSPYWGLQAPS